MNIQSTQEPCYTMQLIKEQKVWWKSCLDVQFFSRWNLNRLNPGFVLDIGCGIGRNLINLKGNGVGIDHNFNSVQFVRKLGYKAFMPDEFQKSIFNTTGRFDTIIVAHVFEHMKKNEAVELLKRYEYLLKQGGKIIIITPQEAGYKKDPTHIEFMDFVKLRYIMKELKFEILKEYSFPFPRIFGNLFIYNEFVSVNSRL
jgi:2-polyprenyl-3-methyl-5-hydroxy-6-metoxy-1,4-benzoquinol methylase